MGSTCGCCKDDKKPEINIKSNIKMPIKCDCSSSCCFPYTKPKEKTSLSNEGKWRLSAAYALIGQMEVAKKMIYNTSSNAKAYQDYYYTYGSIERDEAMILETMTLLKDTEIFIVYLNFNSTIED